MARGFWVVIASAAFACAIVACRSFGAEELPANGAGLAEAGTPEAGTGPSAEAGAGAVEAGSTDEPPLLVDNDAGLFAEGTFENANESCTPGFLAAGSTLMRSGDHWHGEGDRSCKVCPGGALGSPFGIFTQPFAKVKPGKIYKATAWVLPESGLAAQFSVTVRARFGSLETATGKAPTKGFDAPATWETKSGMLQSPELDKAGLGDDVFAVILVSKATAPGCFFVDDITVSETDQ